MIKDCASSRNNIKNWAIRDDRICKEFKFTTFSAAIAFIVQCSFEADRAKHHPEWKNIYNRVWIELTTHDENTITQKDYNLAEKFDSIYGYFCENK